MSQDAAIDDTRTSPIEHHDLDIDGVRVLHFPDGADRTEATLVFGVGQRDETLATAGTLHCLEHLVMTEVRRTPIDINGCVSTSSTRFTADGSPDHVAAFLAGVCVGLADPPISRLAHEARVLEAEEDGGGGSSPAWFARYGFADLGVIDGPGPGARGVSEASVRETAARWFVTDNALLVIEGAWPDRLSLPLRAGSRPTHADVPARRFRRPQAVTVDGPACELSLVMPRTVAGAELLAWAVIDHRLTEVLRYQHGLMYTLDVSAVSVTGGGYLVEVAADPTPERVRECFRVMVETVRQLAAEGPTAEELAHARDVVLETMRGRGGAIQAVVAPALDALIGSPGPTADPADVVAVEDQAVTHLLRGMTDDLVVVVDEAAEPELIELGIEPFELGVPVPASGLPAGRVFRPPLIALATDREARRSRVVLTSTGLAQVFDGRAMEVAWSDVVGVMRQAEGPMVVFAAGGQAIPVGPTLYKEGYRLVDAVLSHVPGRLIYDDPDEPRS